MLEAGDGEAAAHMLNGADRSAEVDGAIFLHKPYQPSQIIETIRKLLG